MKEWIVSADSTDDLYCGYFEMYKDLIRCKDCTFYQEDSHECGMEIDWFYMPDDGFCSRAVRREEDEDIQNN